jgi:site-specific DNA-methyltransferase (adenine-specific)
VPNKKTPKPIAQYRRKAPRRAAPKPGEGGPATGADLPHAKPIEPRHFELRDDGTIWKTNDGITSAEGNKVAKSHSIGPNAVPSPGEEGQGEGGRPAEFAVPDLILKSDNPFIRLYHGDCFQLLDTIAAKHPEGRFDAIFADPPYFLSNGGITCHAGRMVKVDKGDWDKSRGPEVNHEFNLEWLKRCQRVLKPNGTIWVSGTHHVIFSIGYAMQQLGFKILNDIAWEKPNPPPNLSCRYFTHSTETILWAARDEKSKHVFNYDAMRAVTGKQMKTVWRDIGAKGNHSHPPRHPHPQTATGGEGGRETDLPCPNIPQSALSNPHSIWTLTAPGSDEKVHGKHPTQKPVALIERCLLASTNPGDLVLDPFLGGGTTAIAALKLKRGCVGIEADLIHITLAVRRTDTEMISIWLRYYAVTISVSIFACAKPIANPERILSLSPALAVQRPTPGKGPNNPINPERVLSNSAQIDLDLFTNSINGSCVDDKPQSQIPTERIFHETKFVFLSCAEVERGAVVHTTVDVSLQEAWAKTPTGKKRETTHIVRCETEIFRVAAKQ